MLQSNTYRVTYNLIYYKQHIYPPIMFDHLFYHLFFVGSAEKRTTAHLVFMCAKKEEDGWVKVFNEAFSKMAGHPLYFFSHDDTL